MPLLDQLIEKMLREPDAKYPPEVTVIIFGLITLFELAILIAAVRAYRRLENIDVSSSGPNAFVWALFSIALIPAAGFLNYLCRVLTGSTHTIVLSGSKDIFYVLGLMLFTIFYAMYAREVLHLSRGVQHVYRYLNGAALLLGTVSIAVMSVHVLSPLNENLVLLFLIVAGGIFAASIIMTMVFSLVDYRRISNRLIKVRLGMTMLSGVALIIQGIVIVVYLLLLLSFSKESWGWQLFILSVMDLLLYTMPFLAAVVLYWGFFIPEKLQEWTGILPPSFKQLKEKQRRLQALRTITESKLKSKEIASSEVPHAKA